MLTCPTGSGVGSTGCRGGSVFAGRGEEAAVGPAPPRLQRELIGAGMAACPGLPAFEPLPEADKPDWLEPGSAPAHGRQQLPARVPATPAPLASTAGSAWQRPARCPLLWTVVGQFYVAAGEEEEEKEEEEEEVAVGCSRRCPSWGGLSVRVMGMHPALGAPDPLAWEGVPNCAGGMMGLCVDAFWQTC